MIFTSQKFNTPDGKTAVIAGNTGTALPKPPVHAGLGGEGTPDLGENTSTSGFQYLSSVLTALAVAI
ncbi:hypothetical protein PL10110_330083 [Planktothrix agardhii]|nr:hypothetical protein PL10110_330083 [Planktothrix agardhii]